MSDKQGSARKSDASGFSDLIRQLLRHPIAVVFFAAQSIFLLSCTYMSGIPKSEVTASPKRVAVIVFRKSILESPFSSASERHYFALSVDSKGTVVGKQEISFANTSLDTLRQRIRLAAVIPFSIPWQLAALAFFGVFAFSLLRILEIATPSKRGPA
ncbi:MAG: hypothetical protein WCI75_14630 [candidate division NC10 bacterium]